MTQNAHDRQAVRSLLIFYLGPWHLKRQVRSELGRGYRDKVFTADTIRIS